MQILSKTVDFLNMPIIGDIQRADNIDILQQDFETEKSNNDPTATIGPILLNYKNSVEKYGERLYEPDRSFKFFDVDVFRQPALHFKEHGHYCPYDPDWDTYAHKMYWDTQEYRLKNGMTAVCGTNEDGSPRKVWIPGKHYGFLNFAPINRVVDDDDAIDNEAEFIEGVDDDDLAVFKLEVLLKELNIRDTRVAKKMVDFPDFFDAQFHAILYKYICRLLGKNCWLGKARRKGMSYYNSWDLFDDINLNPAVAVILAAHDKKYLTQGKGLMRMLYGYSDFINKFTDFAKDRLVSNKEHLKFGFVYEGEKEERGYLSEALAVSAMNNPDVTIGKDAFQLAYEEMGKFPNWKESYNVTTSTAEAGDFKTGHITGWGTGGTEEANWEAFEDVCYNPTVYDGLACNNVWDPGKNGTGVAYFYSHVDGLEGHMDYNGNTNFTTAWESYEAKKEVKKATLTDTSEFEKWCGQRANSPQEAFAKSATNIFPRAQITLQLNRVKTDPHLKYLSRNGKLVKEQGRVRLLPNYELERLNLETHDAINDFPLRRGTDVHGCFVEWIPPWRDPKTGLIPEGLYVAFQDPYAHDKDVKNLTTKDSLGATYWYENINRFTPLGGGIPVAAYVGRPPRMDDYNEQVAYGLEYYNAKMMFENERGDVKPFMKARKLLHYLYEEPELLFAKELQSKTGRGYGMHMTDKRIARAAIYLRDQLTMKITKDKIFLDYVYDIGFLEELLRWGMKGNYDRVSAWLIGMFIIKELETNEIEPPKAVDENSLFNRKHY